jgi:16S rRNA (cytosine967-C5)-methyltransferase
MARTRLLPQTEVPGLAARRVAADVIDGVLRRKTPLDDQLSGKSAHPALPSLAERDRALMRRLVGTVLRRLGSLRHLLGGFLERGFPADAPRAETILLLGAAQILWLEVPDHAAVDLSVRLAQADRRASRYAGLVNAVLRRVTQTAASAKASSAKIANPMKDTPAWLLARWTQAYGRETARAIAAANGEEPALDITVKQDPQFWADRVHGRVLPTGSVRTLAHGAISLLPGFHEGAWWVQDAAAAIPARLFGDLTGRTVADLCAAPGGKTAQLALAGGKVTALDRSAQRLSRLRDNFGRLSLAAEVIAADLLDWQTPPFDAVLLDAPCTSTGTIRRHPDVPWLKSEADIVTLAAMQARLLDRAVELTRPGGTLVYCVCSLEPEEGERQIEALLARDPRVTRKAVAAAELWGHAEFINATGDLRTLPMQLPDAEPRWAGLDGFYAARLSRI